MRRLPRIWRPLATLLAVLWLPDSARAAAWPDPDPSETGDVVVEVRIDHGPTAVFTAIANDSILLVPVRQLLGLAEIRITDVRTGAFISGTLEPSGTRFEFDITQHLVRRGAEVRPLAVEDAVWRGGDLYVTESAIEWALGVTLQMDWTELALLVQNTDNLPVVRRMEREQRRQALLGLATNYVEPVSVSTRSRSPSGLVVDWGYIGSTRDPINTSTLDLAAGVTVLGGALDFQYLRQSLVGTSNSEIWLSWTKAWPNQPWLRQMRLGDFVTSSRVPQSIRGIELTNLPYLRKIDFGGALFRSQLPAGWEVDAYSDSRFLGSSTVDPSGNYQFGIPLQYGQNPVDLVAYGPNGEVIRRSGNIVIPQERIQGGRFEYDVNVGQCRTVVCRGSASAAARYGVSNGLTIEAGGSYFTRDSLDNLWYPYGVVSFAATRFASVTVEGIYNALARGRIDIDPSSRLHLDVGHTRFDSAFASPLIGSANDLSRTEGVVFWNPSSFGGNVFVQGAGAYTAGRSVSSSFARLGVTARLHRLQLLVGARREGFHDQVGGVGTTTYALDAGATVTWRSSFFRAEVTANPQRGISRGLIGLGQPLGRVFRLDASALWTGLNTGPIIDLAITTALPGLRAISRGQYFDGHLEGTNQVEGTVVVDARTRTVGFGQGRTLGQAGITGDVFYDTNGNGKRDAGEQGVGGVMMQVGSRGVQADSTGRFRTWDLVPYESTIVRVDTLTIPDPRWVPAQPALRIDAPPNGYTAVPVPLIRAVEVSGSLILEGGAPVGGVTVLLRNLATGRVARTTTFTDGTFYVSGIIPGEYGVELTAAEVARLEIGLVPVTLTITPGQTGVVEVSLHVTRHPSTSASQRAAGGGK